MPISQLVINIELPGVAQRAFFSLFNLESESREGGFVKRKRKEKYEGACPPLQHHRSGRGLP